MPTETLPVFITREPLLQPGVPLPLRVGRPDSVAACRQAWAGECRLLVLAQHDPSVEAPEPADVYRVGVEAQLLMWTPVGGGVYAAHLVATEVVRVEALSTDAAVWRAEVAPVPTGDDDVDPTPLAEAMRAAAASEGVPPEALAHLSTLPAESLAGFAAANARADLGPEALQALLELPLSVRVRRLTAWWAARAPGSRPPEQRPGPVEPDTLGECPEGPAAIGWTIQRYAREGGLTVAELLDAVVCELERTWADDPGLAALGEEGDIADLVEARVADAHAAWLARGRSWAAPTLADRLEQALAGLADLGIAHAWPDAWEAEEVLEAFTSGVPRGVVFAQPSDVEAAIAGFGVALCFGTTTPGIPAESIGRMVVAAIEAAGLPVWWSGRAEDKIIVPIPWRRRLR